jgi:hypothetical protein
MGRVRIFALALAAAAVFGLAPTAGASYIVDRNVKHPTLMVNRRGYALVQYTRQDGQRRHVFFWGAINSIPNEDLGKRQVRFQTDYTGGWAAFGNANYWKRFKNACRPYDGPPLTLFVAGCKAPDGSYWALQGWVRLEAMRGLPPFKPEQSAVELHLSHWSGLLPLLQVWPNWTYGGQLQGFFGRLTYQGLPVYGSPSSSFSEYVFIDTLDSVYGPGWKHDTAIGTHKRNGAFCYSFVPQWTPSTYPVHELRGPGLGERHRIRLMGPGVTPVLEWEGARLGPYDPVQDAQINAIFDQVMSGDRVCANER